MKSLLSLVANLLADAGRRCGVSTASDFNTVRRRVEHEGLSFLTITLPDFSKQFEYCLDKKSVGSDDFSGFRRSRGLPAFMQGFLRQVFDQCTGDLLDDPSITCIREVRQVCRFLSKYGDRCSPEREQAAFEGYVKCEQELKMLELSKSSLEEISSMSNILWADLFSWMDQQIYLGENLPKHSGGSTADGLRGNMKYRQNEWPSRSENSFPSWEFLVPNFSTDSLKRLGAVEFLEPGTERPVRVKSVPKTQRTARIIAMEPTCMQYMQQSLLEMFKRGFRHFPVSSALVCFDSQFPNQELARVGSLNGDLATLDLSEASDRVHYQLVKALLNRHSLLFQAIDDCRSTRADVRGHGIISLTKFASMGSAVCFPIESLVFATIVFLGIQDSTGHQLSRKEINHLLPTVRVYGDDIIVPSRYASGVSSRLESLGLKVNRHKSFWNGLFRESCGKDYYAGHDVSVVKCRSPLPETRSAVSEVISAVSLRNQLFEAGYHLAVEFLDSLIERVITFPYVESLDSPLLGRLTREPVIPDRFNFDLFRPEMRGFVVKSRLPASRLDGLDALMKFFLKRSDDPYEDGHLQRAGRSVSVTLKAQWAPPY